MGSGHGLGEDEGMIAEPLLHPLRAGIDYPIGDSQHCLQPDTDERFAQLQPGTSNGFDGGHRRALRWGSIVAGESGVFSSSPVICWHFVATGGKHKRRSESTLRGGVATVLPGGILR
jgi:hypothetical protein